MKNLLPFAVIFILFIAFSNKKQAKYSIAVEKPVAILSDFQQETSVLETNDSPKVDSLQEEKPEKPEKSIDTPKYVDGDIIIMQFSATWCLPCQRLKAVIKNSESIQYFIKNKTKGYFLIDVDKQDEVTRAWVRLSKVSSYPLTVKYQYQNGKWVEIDRVSGFVTELKFITWLNKV